MQTMSSSESTQEDNEDSLFFEIQEESNCLYIPWHSQPFPFHGYGPVVPSNHTDLSKPWIFARKYPKELEEKVHKRWGWIMVDGVGRVKLGKTFEPSDKVKRVYKRKHAKENIEREDRVEVIHPKGAAMFRDLNSANGDNVHVVVHFNQKRRESVYFSTIYESEGKLYARSTSSSYCIEPVRRILASSLHDSFAVISDSMVSWYRDKGSNSPIRRYQAGKRIIDVVWDTNEERLLILFEDGVHLIGPKEQLQIIEASLASDARAIPTFDGFVLISMHERFYQMNSETGGLIEFNTAFEFGRILLLTSSDAVTGTPWLAAFASDKMVGVIDSRSPTLPLTSWTLDQFIESVDTKIHDLTMANLNGIEHVIVCAGGNVIVIPLHYEIVAGHRLVCGRPVMLPTRSSNPGMLQISGSPLVLGVACDAETGRAYAVYEDGTIGCTFIKPDSLEPQADLEPTPFKQHAHWRPALIDLRRLLPLFKQSRTEIEAFTVDPLFYGENSRLYTSFPKNIRIDEEHGIMRGPQRKTSAIEALMRNWDLTTQEDNQREKDKTHLNEEVSENDDAGSAWSATDEDMGQEDDYGDSE